LHAKKPRCRIGLLPEHLSYCEVFAGAAWVFFRKELAKYEVINDLDTDLTTFYRVLQNHLEEFLRQFEWVLCSPELFGDWQRQQAAGGLTEIQRTSVLQSLGIKRYNAVAAAFEDAHRYFSATPPDLKAAVRSMFESVEILAKLMVRTDRLTAKLVSNDIKTLVLNVYTGDAVAQRAIGRAIEGFADWVDGLHHYRHGQGEEDPVAPPEDFAIYALSSGAAFLRWLVRVDTALQSANVG
jgi:hypothetical protein